MPERCSTCELKDKEVINLCDGRRLGYISDFIIDLCDGRITAIRVPEDGGCFGFRRGEEIVIPWGKIQTIGEDAILVEVCPISGAQPSAAGDEVKQKKKKNFFF